MENVSFIGDCPTKTSIHRGMFDCQMVMDGLGDPGLDTSKIDPSRFPGGHWESAEPSPEDSGEACTEVASVRAEIADIPIENCHL